MDGNLIARALSMLHGALMSPHAPARRRYAHAAMSAPSIPALDCSIPYRLQT